MAEPSRQQLVQVAEQLQQQLESLETQREQLGEFLNEIEQTKQAIDTIGDADPDEKILLPLGSGAFVHARLTESNTVLAPIGGGVLAEEAPEKARQRLESREKEARAAQEEVKDNMQALEQRLQNLVGSLQGQGGPAGPAKDPSQGPENAG